MRFRHTSYLLALAADPNLENIHLFFASGQDYVWATSDIW